MSSTIALDCPGAAATSTGASYQQMVPLAAVVAAVAALLLADSRFPLVGPILGLAFGSAVLARVNIGWALVPPLIVELTISNYMVAELGMSARLAMVLVGVAVALPTITRRLSLADASLRRVLIPAVALFGIATLVNALYTDDAYVVQYARYQVVLVLTLALAATTIGQRRELRVVLLAALAIAIIAAVAATWQHYSKDSAPYGATTAAAVMKAKGRSVGLAAIPVHLANQLPQVLLPLLGLLASGPWRTDRNRLLLAGAGFILIAGLNYTYTRSAVLAAALGLVPIALLLGGRRRKIILLILIGAAVMFPLLEGTGLIGHRYYRTAEDDRSAATHEALLAISLGIALDSPILGVGHQQFQEISSDVAAGTDAEGVAGVGKHQPHNDFMNVWLSWGIFALVAYVAMFTGALANFRLAARSDDPLVRGVSVGCAGGLITYAVNSAFHNYMDSSTLLWMYAGLSVALVRLARAGSGQRLLRAHVARPLRRIRRASLRED